MGWEFPEREQYQADPSVISDKKAMNGAQESQILQAKTKAHMQIDSHHLGGLGVLVDWLGFNSTPNSDLMTLQSRTLYLKELEYFTGF